jgi:hypothetical protein
MTYEELRSLAHSFGFDISWDQRQPDLLITDACVRAEAMGRPPDRYRDPRAWEDWGSRFFHMLLDIGAKSEKPCMCSKCSSQFSTVTPDGKRLTITIGPKVGLRL